MDIASISSLPTDSLYKFMSISGLLLAVFSLVFTGIFKKNLREKIYATLKKIYAHKVDLEILNFKNEEHEFAFTFIKEKAGELRGVEKVGTLEGGNTSYEKSVNSLISSLDSHEDKQHSLWIETYDLKKITKVLSVETEELIYLKSEDSRLTNMNRMLIFLGSALALFGFYLWYTKLQVYVDAYHASQCI